MVLIANIEARKDFLGDFRSFLGVTCHSITEDFKRHSFALACRRVKGAHTFDVIATELQSILCDFKIQNKVHRIVTDNGSNFVKAFRIFSQLVEPCTEEGEECEKQPTSIDFFDEEPLLPSVVLPPHQRCAAHLLNLVATKDTEKALDDSNFRNASRSMFAKASAVWNKQSRTVTAAENIKRTTNRQLITPNATRWNSTFDSVKCLHQLEADSLNKMCDSLGLPRFSARDAAFMAEFVQVMEPLARCFDFLQGEKCVGLGSLLPQLETLKARLELQRDKADICRPLAEAALQGIDKRFSLYYEDRECLLAAVSDPRRKLAWTRDVAVREKARSVFVSECDKFKPVTPPAKEGENGDEDFFVFSNMPEAPELSSYLSEPSTSSLSALENFPRIKALFLRTNTTLPSSAAVERLFSCAGLILTKNRSRLTDENFEARVLIKFNKEL